MKTKKSTKKFAASGKLKKTIQVRHKQRVQKKKIEGRKARKNKRSNENGPSTSKSKASAIHSQDDEDEEYGDDVELARPSKPLPNKKSKQKAGSESLGEEEEDAELESDEDRLEEEDEDDDASFASVDDLEDEGENHLIALSKLAEKDPEFYKYLQENDKELLDFNLNDKNEEEEDTADDDEMEDDGAPTLTEGILKQWQSAMLKHRSLRALRKLLIAFRAAAHTNDEDVEVSWNIDSPVVFNKVVTTALKYTPVVLEHHIPYKILPDGRFKPPVQSPKQKTLEKLVASFFSNTLHLISHLSDAQTLSLTLQESAKLIPYITSHRKLMKVYVKTCLNAWSTTTAIVSDDDEEDMEAQNDSVRIAAFFSLKRVTQSSDDALCELVLKGLYSTLVKISKNTSAHTIGSINLMKNTAAEIYCTELLQGQSYQLAFGYIRQMAILLRNSMKGMNKDSYKQVYNWQFVHSVDFWCIVLSRACERQKETRSGVESELKPLIYPLVQVSLGAIKLVPTPRYFPLHLHLARSLLELTKHTKTYIALPAYLTPILLSISSPSSSKSKTTLKPIDLELTTRAQTQYLKTRIYCETLCEEICYILAEWACSLQDCIALPEVLVPVLSEFRRCLKLLKKSTGGGKLGGSVKTLVERLEDGAKWTRERRNKVKFEPANRTAVDAWQREVSIEETPLGKYAAVLRKAREKRRAVLEKARKGKGELLEE